MPPKKGLEAFLKKQGKKGKKTTKAEETKDLESEVLSDQKEQIKDDAKNTPAAKKKDNSSDDEEEDELDLAT